MRVGYPTSLTRSLRIPTRRAGMAPQAPQILGVPAITGDLRPGATLVADPAETLAQPPALRSWQWLRDGIAVPQATGPSLVLGPGDVGASFRVVQTETNAAGSDTAASAPTGPVAVPPPVPGPTLTLDGFIDNTDTARLSADQDGNLDWALVRGPGWFHDSAGFSGPDVLESGPAGVYTVAGGAQGFTPAYTGASAPATTLVIGLSNANGADTVSTAFTPNLPPARMAAPTLEVVDHQQVTVTLSAAPEGYQNGVSGHDLRYRAVGGGWTTVTGITSPHDVAGLSSETPVEVQTRGVNVDGPGAWSPGTSAVTAAPAPSGPAVRYTGFARDLAGFQTATAPGMAIGPADPGRRVGVLVATSLSGAGNIETVTIGGVPATALHNDHSTGSPAAPDAFTTSVWEAIVPTGTTADVVISVETGTQFVGINFADLLVFTKTGGGMTADVASVLTAANDAMSVQVSAPRNASVFAVTRHGAIAGSPFITWTGPDTSVYADNAGGFNVQSAAYVEAVDPADAAFTVTGAVPPGTSFGGGEFLVAAAIS